MAPSASGPPPPPRAHPWSPESRRRSPGRSTRTSGSTCRTTAGSRSAATRRPSREQWRPRPPISCGARGVEIWAALAALGRSGLADLVERCCRHATRFAHGLRAAGYEVLNEVTLNQVLVSFGDDAATRAVIAAVQADGTCWCGGTVWHGQAAMRIRISSWATTADDVEQSLAAMLRLARRGVPCSLGAIHA